MTLDELKTYINDNVTILSADNIISDHECEVRASKCLDIMYKIGVATYAVEVELLKRSSIEKAMYSQVLSQETSAKNITEKKAHAEANPQYINALESKEILDAELNFLKSMAKIFENGHIFYRRKLGVQ